MANPTAIGQSRADLKNTSLMLWRRIYRAVGAVMTAA
jgi:hypothetical protein